MDKDKISIEQLGREYEKHAKLQQYFIDKCKAEINKAESVGDLSAVEELKTKLRKFREIKYELQNISAQLKDYYKGEK